MTRAVVPTLERFEHVAKLMDVDVDTLADWLETIADAWFGHHDGSTLDTATLDVLRGMGLLDLHPVPFAERTAVRSAAQYLSLIRFSYTLGTLAHHQGTSPETLLSLVRDRSLFALTVNGELLFPAFQFAGWQQVPGIDAVFRALPHDLDPLSIVAFVSRPCAELERDDRTLSPLQWLAAGEDPKPVVALAADVGLPS